MVKWKIKSKRPLIRGEKLSIAMMRAWFESSWLYSNSDQSVEKLLAQGNYLESSVNIEESTKRVKNANSIQRKM